MVLGSGEVPKAYPSALAVSAKPLVFRVVLYPGDVSSN